MESKEAKLIKTENRMVISRDWGDYRQQDYAQQMINEYKAAGINPRDVWPQSNNKYSIML